MSLENKVKCKKGCEDSLLEKIEEHNICNYLFGLSTAIPVAIINSALIGLSFTLGIVFYFILISHLDRRSITNARNVDTNGK